MATDAKVEAFEGWAVLELMGHRRLGGYIREANFGGATCIRIDIPGEPGGPAHATQFYAPGAMYCLTPCSEEAARAVAKHNRPEPVTTWEMPRLEAKTRPSDGGYEEADY